MKRPRRSSRGSGHLAWLAPWLGIGLALAVAGSGCGASSNGERPRDEPPGKGGAPPAAKVTITFPQAPISVAPRELKTIQIKASPEAAYTVRLSLLGSADASADDAALDRGERVSDPRGNATFQLTAPSRPGTLRMRAQVGDAFADTEVIVRPDATVTLVVRANYRGKRSVAGWLATATPDAACEGLDPTAPNYYVRSPVDSPLRLEGVPLASRFAVTTSAGALASGCTTIVAPLPNVDNLVDVDIEDRPVNLATTALDLLFSLEAKDPTFTAELDSALSDLGLRLRGDALSDAAALLDEIEATLTPARAEIFRATRTAVAWDTTLFGRNSETRLADTLQRWQASGRTLLFSARAIEARISGMAASVAPTFDTNRVAGLPAGDASIASEPHSWSIDASDTLSFSTTLYWYPQALVASLATAPAIAETGADGIPAALAHDLGCSALASGFALDKRQAVKDFVATCDAACFEFACEDALAALWDRAATASATDESTELLILGTAAARVDELAGAVGVSELNGNWVGRLSRGRQTTQTGGKLKGYRSR